MKCKEEIHMKKLKRTLTLLLAAAMVLALAACSNSSGGTPATTAPESSTPRLRCRSSPKAAST